MNNPSIKQALYLLEQARTQLPMTQPSRSEQIVFNLLVGAIENIARTVELHLENEDRHTPGIIE